MIARARAMESDSGQSRTLIALDLQGQPLTQHAWSCVTPPFGRGTRSKHVVGTRVAPRSRLVVGPPLGLRQPFDKIDREISRKRRYGLPTLLPDIGFVQIAKHQPKRVLAARESTLDEPSYG